MVSGCFPFKLMVWVFPDVLRGCCMRGLFDVPLEYLFALSLMGYVWLMGLVDCYA